MLHKKFLHPNQLSTLVDLLREDCSQPPRRRAAALFVCTPYSFSLACTDDEFFFLFDSHSHLQGRAGALIACTTILQAVDYLHYFFSTHYPGLFDDEIKVAHLTFLSLS